jgi:hypothetical protein
MRVQGDLVTAAAHRDERRALKRGEAIVQVPADSRLRGGLAWELGVRIDRRALIVDGGFHPQPIYIGGAISRLVVITPARDTGRTPRRATVEEQQLLAPHRQRHQLGEETGQPRPASPHDDVALQSGRILQDDPTPVSSRAGAHDPRPVTRGLRPSALTARSARRTSPSGSSSTNARSSPRKLGKRPLAPRESRRSTGIPCAASIRSDSDSHPCGRWAN